MTNMASIYFRKYGNRGVWWVTYYQGGAKVQKSLRTKDRTVAVYRKNSIEKELAEGQKPSQLRAFVIKLLAVEYLRYCEARQTHRSFTTTKGRLMRFLEGLRVARVQDITANDIQTYITRRIEQDEISNKTANHILTAIK